MYIHFIEKSSAKIHFMEVLDDGKDSFSLRRRFWRMSVEENCDYRMACLFFSNFQNEIQKSFFELGTLLFILKPIL